MPSSIFDEDTPADIITRVQPDVLVKGADWAADQIVGRDTVEARGGKVVRIPVEQGWSTSDILGEDSRRAETRRLKLMRSRIITRALP